MSWQLLTAISVLSLAVSVILQRILIHKDKSDPYAYAVIFQGIVGVLLVAYTFAFHGFRFPGMEPLLLPAFLCIVLYGAGHIVYAKTLQRVEASAFSVLFATQAFWIMLLGIVLFRESLTLLQVIGAALIFLGVGILVRQPRTLLKDKGTLLGLLTGLLFGLAITGWSYVGRHTDTLSWAAISFVGTSIAAFLIRPQTISKIPPLFTPEILRKLLLLGVFYAIGCVAMLFAYKFGSFAVVSPLRQTGIIVTVLLALVLLPQERTMIRRKVIAALICTTGVLLVVA